MAGLYKKQVYIKEIEINYKKKRIKSKFNNVKLTDPKIVYELFYYLQNDSKEKIITISLDRHMKILCYEIVAIGGIDGIYTREFEVIRSAVALNAYGIIVVHNHPSGNPEPSDTDIIFTKKLLFLAETGGLNFYDHIIIGNNNYYSIDENYSMKKLYEEKIQKNNLDNIL